MPVSIIMLVYVVDLLEKNMMLGNLAAESQLNDCIYFEQPAVLLFRYIRKLIINSSRFSCLLAIDLIYTLGLLILLFL